MGKRKKRVRPRKSYKRYKFIGPKNIVGYKWTGRYTDLCTGSFTTSSSPEVLKSDGNCFEHTYYVSNKKPFLDNFPCRRVKNQVTWRPYPTYSKATSVATHRCSDGSYNYRTYEDFRESSGICSSSPFGSEPRLPVIPDVASKHLDALTFFASGCTPLDINLAVNLFEIGDTVKLIHAAGKALLNLKTFYRETRQYWRDWKQYIYYITHGFSGDHKKFLLGQDRSKELANLHLAWSFAIAPLTADIKKWNGTLEKVRDHVDYLIKNNKKPVPVRFTADITDLGPAVQSVTFPAVPATTELSGSQSFTTHYEGKYVAYATMIYDVSKYTRKDLLKRFMNKALGFLDPGVFLLEIIPFSFVLEWFTNVLDFLKYWTSIPPIPYKLIRSGYWIRIYQVVTYTYYFYYSSLYTPRILLQDIKCVDEREYFERFVDIPLTYQGIDFSVPGIKQALLGLSLGRQALS